MQNAVEKDAAPHHSLFSSDFLLPAHRERVPDYVFVIFSIFRRKTLNPDVIAAELILEPAIGAFGDRPLVVTE
ncbi:MAG: hypothetical protein L6Q55_12715 [Azonexus sp.]|nr:hypothetical protein [Azonexus sp.]MCK6413272.1 hypothetical protein [Azonexus sp.]